MGLVQPDLDRAIEAIGQDEVAASVEEALRILVLAVSAEVALLWVRARDGDEELHLLGAEGMSAREKTRLARGPLPVAMVRSLTALGPHHSIARLLGLRWVGAAWLRADDLIGALVVGTRTDRRPGPEELDLLAEAGSRLAVRFRSIKRGEQALRKLTRRTAADWIEEQPGLGDGPLSILRPREQTVLGLYADGLGANEIAHLLVVSPHTVRTHVKNAFRRLGIHSRDEAAALVRDHEIGRLF